MIDPDTRKAIYRLHQEGMSLREIARRMKVGRNTVRAIIEQKGEMPEPPGKEKSAIDVELLSRLFKECDGRIQRVYEKLVEEENIEVKYSTLTRILRKLGITHTQNERCDRVPDEPGKEMQHDTTVYKVKLGDKQTRLVASLLYLRYSKRRYLKFYRSFNRFRMKCFFHESLMYWGVAAAECIIDNTNLARLRGTGRNAVICPEMASFSKQYGFQYRCHELRHSNRKAGEERSFWTVETNFLPGRTFESLEDMNKQAFDWATNRMEHRPQTKARIIPAKAFEHEQSYLIRLPGFLPEPYLAHERKTDQYGFVALRANYYWVPGDDRPEVKVLEYSDRLKIYHERRMLAEYRLPPDGVTNQVFSPEGLPKPRYQPRQRKKPTQEEEKRLRAMAKAVDDFLNFALKGMGVRRHRFLRELFALAQQTSPSVFVMTIERALRYRITCIKIIRRIATLCMGQNGQNLPQVDVDETFQEREAYQEGRLTDAPDFSVFDELLEDDDEKEEEENDG